jgi:LCP family protein required for cell wall assembly
MIHKRKLLSSGDDFILEQKKAKKGKKVFLIQAIVFLFCCLLIGWAWGGIFGFLKNIGASISQSTRAIVGRTIGTQPRLDEQWNLNIALIGYGWWGHQGTYLTDSMIITSINPSKWTMAMLSLPRDMYVKKPNGNYGKINSVFESAFYQNDKDYDKASPILLNKFSEITWIPLTYYAYIDFEGFEKFIDSLEWIEIDVPEPIYDSSYPGENNSYIIFSLSSGTQILDGATALKYARSRHSTSDYSRSMRQQAIIQAILDKILSASTLLNPSKIKALYEDSKQRIHTNLSLDEILRWLPFAGSLKHKTSWQVAACGASQWQRAQAGCLLYTPPMDQYGWASVQIPVWGWPNDYKVIQSYVQDIVMDSDFIQEQPTIRVLNGVSTWANTKARLVPLANNTAIDLIKAWFTVYDIGNAPAPLAQTTLVTNWPGWEDSIKRVLRYFPNAIVSAGPIVPDGPSLTLTIWDSNATWAQTKDLPLYLLY